jgi:AraC-like DNA-binding protein
MKYKIHIPQDKILQRFIQYFWIVKHESKISAFMNPTLHPEHFFDLVLNFGDAQKWKSQDADFIVNRSHLIGIRDKPFVIEQLGKVDFFAIRFKPNGLYPFLKFPLSEIILKPFDLNDIIGSLTDKFENEIYNLHNDEAKFIKMEELLINEISFNHANNAFVDYSLMNIHQSKGVIKVTEICNQLNINDKYLQRKFSEYIGVSPKYYIQIIRFNNAIKSLSKSNKPDLIRVALENGYYDHAHFTKEFKKFAGLTPTDYLIKKNSMFDMYN